MGRGTVAEETTVGVGTVAEAAELAMVDFKVDFVQKGTINLMVLNEKSTFRKVDGTWLYAKGDVSYAYARAHSPPAEACELAVPIGVWPCRLAYRLTMCVCVCMRVRVGCVCAGRKRWR